MHTPLHIHCGHVGRGKGEGGRGGRGKGKKGEGGGKGRKRGEGEEGGKMRVRDASVAESSTVALGRPFIKSEIKRQCNFLSRGDGHQGIHTKVELIGHKEMAELRGV